MNRVITSCTLLLLFASCNFGMYPSAKKRNKYIHQMMAADSTASVLSSNKYFAYSMLQNLDTNAVILLPNHYPLTGDTAIQHYRNARDTTFILVWTPSGGRIARSCDFGFTYGIYTLTSQLDGTVRQGTYATAWQKRKGVWRMILDTGNPGLGN